MFQKTIARKVLYPFAAATLVIGGTIAASPANALLSDNVRGSGAGGLTNCTGDGVCIEKVGDEIEVSYEVQMSNMMTSSDHGQTVAGSMIAFPSVIQDPKLEVVATSIESSDYEKDKEILKRNGKDSYTPVSEYDGSPVHEFDKPVEVPTLTPDEVEEGKPYDGGEISFDLTDIDNMDKDSSYVKRYSKDNKEGEYDDLFYATHIKGEKILKDYKKTGKNGDTIKDMGDVEGISKESKIYNASLEKAGAMPVDSTYDYFTFDNDTSRGVNTYRVSGKVKSESDLGFLPIRAKQGFWKCGQEGNGFGFTDNREWKTHKRENGEWVEEKHNGCQNLMEYEWARSDDTLPEYSLKNDEVTKNNIKNNTENGLAGSKKCAVTEDIDRYDLVGQDVEPRKLSSDRDSSNSWGGEYTKTFKLHANPAVTYLVGSWAVAEDGCDQAGVKIELCNEDTPDETPKTTPEETPSTTPKKTPSTTTVGDTPSDKTTTSSKTTTPSATTPVKTTTPSTPVETTIKDTPETTPNTTMVKPGAKTIVKPRKVTPSIPNKEYSPVEVVTPVKESTGPSVKTGGEVNTTSFFNKIFSVFK